MDLVMEFKWMWDSVGFLKINMEWMPNHVDEEDDEPQEMTINRIVDNLATVARGRLQRKTLTPATPVLLPGTVAMLSINGQIVHNKLKSHIIYACQAEDMLKYLEPRNDWDDTVIKLINWDAVRQALQTKTMSEKRSIIKMIHGWQNTNKRQNYEDNSVAVECAECDQIEDSDHILKCDSVFRRNGRQEACRKLKRQIGPYTDKRVLHNMWLGVHSYVDEHVPEHGPLYSV
jgi:hypothetical protein